MSDCCAIGCTAPSGLNTTNITPAHAKLNRNTNGYAVNYKIKYRPVGITTWINKNVNGNSGYKSIGGLNPNTQYQWRIRTNCSINPVLWPVWSTTASFTTPLKLLGDEAEITLNIYSSSVSGQLMMETDKTVDFITIQNLLVEIVLEESVVENKVDVSALPYGVYLHAAFADLSKATIMFMKQ